jgi:hypothetical protein
MPSFNLDAPAHLGYENLLQGINLQSLALNAGPRLEYLIAGTASITAASGAVTGSGTLFASLSIGQAIKIGQNVGYVATIVSNTSITILPVAVSTETAQPVYIDFPLAAIENGAGNVAFSILPSGMPAYASNFYTVVSNATVQLTATQLLGGVVEVTGTTATALTLPSSASLVAALPLMPIGHAFDVHIASMAATSTLTANADALVTVGSATATLTSARANVRVFRTAATTFVAYLC